MLAATPARAGTDELCVEQAQGVPGPQPKTPEWWNPALTEDQRETRWTGAAALTDAGSAVPELGSGRVIWDAPSQRLFFEFEVDGDPSLDANQDLVMLAVSDPTGTEPDLYMQFRPVHDCSPASACASPGVPLSTSWVEYAQADNSGTSPTWSALSTTNPSADWTVHDPWVQVDTHISGGNTYHRWSLKFALEIPVDGGTGEAWPDLRVYGNSVMYMPGPTSGSAVEFPLLCEPGSPLSDDCIVYSVGNAPLPAGIPDEHMPFWSHVSTGSLALCDGVEIIRQLVGSDYNPTTGIIPGTTVSYPLPGHQIPRFTGARLRAGFFNDRASGLGSGDVTAEFRIANWGLQWSSWSNASWTHVASASLSGSVSAGGYAGGFGQGAVQTASPWVPAGSGLALSNDHQCMHVRLDSPGGAANFKKDSTYRNMDLVNASVFRRPIDIDMTEREPVDGEEGNEILLLTVSRNMPSRAQCEEAAQQLRGCAEGGPLVLDPGLLEPGDQEEAEDGQRAAAQVQPELGIEPSEGASFDELPASMTYALEKTGGFINLPDASETPVYKVFSAYGYYVQHAGEPSLGWELYRTQPGAEPVPEVPGLYRLMIEVNRVIAGSETFRVIDGVHQPCEGGVPALGEVMPEDVAANRAWELHEEAEGGELAERVIDESDFGCEPPPVREPCELGDCRPHNPIGYVEGSRYVGEWSEEAMAALGPPSAALVAAAADEAEGVIDGELGDLPGAPRAGCCAEASVDPEAKRRGMVELSTMLGMLLLLRRGRGRRR